MQLRERLLVVVVVVVGGGGVVGRLAESASCMRAGTVALHLTSRVDAMRLTAASGVATRLGVDVSPSRVVAVVVGGEEVLPHTRCRLSNQPEKTPAGASSPPTRVPVGAFLVAVDAAAVVVVDAAAAKALVAVAATAGVVPVVAKLEVSRLHMGEGGVALLCVVGLGRELEPHLLHCDTGQKRNQGKWRLGWKAKCLMKDLMGATGAASTRLQ